MKSKGTITNNKYDGVSAEITYENNQLIFSTKPGWVRIVFGVIGEALASTKERFRINISDVICVRISKKWSGKPIFEITTPTDFCKIIFSRDDELTTVLKDLLKDKVM